MWFHFQMYQTHLKKFNDTILNKQKHLLKNISVHEMHNDLILPLSRCGFHGVRSKYGRVCISNTYLRKYM